MGKRKRGVLLGFVRPLEIAQKEEYHPFIVCIRIRNIDGGVSQVCTMNGLSLEVRVDAKV